MEVRPYSEISLQDDLLRYWGLLRQWLWLLVLASLLAGLAAFVTSKIQEPIYQVTSRLLVSEAPASQSSEYQAILTSERLARTYSELLTERPVLEDVIVRLNLDLGPNGVEILRDFIEIQLVRDTQLIEINVEGTDPNQVASIANTIVDVFIERNQSMQASRFADSKASLEEEMATLDRQIRDTLLALERLADTSENQAERERYEGGLAQYRQTRARLLQSYEELRITEAQTTSNVVRTELAVASTQPVRPRVWMNTALAAVVGLMLAVGAVFLFDVLDDTIRRPEDISKHLELPVLGIIAAHDNVSGVPATIREARSPVAEAFRALRTNLQYVSNSRKLGVEKVDKGFRKH